LKELKETRVCLKVITKTNMIKPVKRLDSIQSENDQLISIVGKSIETAKKNINAEKKH